MHRLRASSRWVRTHYAGTRKRERKIGATAADKRRAEKIAEKINAALALGTFGGEEERRRLEAERSRLEAEREALRAAQGKPQPFGPYLRDWHTRYGVMFEPRYLETSKGLIDHHLEPFFGGMDLRAIAEGDLLDYISTKLGAGHKPATILNALSIVRRVLALAVRDELISRNPANGVDRLIARVKRREDVEVPVVESWTRHEVETLLAVAEEEDRRSFRHRHAKDRPGEIRFAPLLRFLLSTGCRRGEALGLQWADVDFDRSRAAIRRSLAKGATGTPKSGKSRSVALPLSLASALFDLLAQRRAECLSRGWAEVPAWVFCA